MNGNKRSYIEEVREIKDKERVKKRDRQYCNLIVISIYNKIKIIVMNYNHYYVYDNQITILDTGLGVYFRFGIRKKFVYVGGKSQYYIRKKEIRLRLV